MTFKQLRQYATLQEEEGAAAGCAAQAAEGAAYTELGAAPSRREAQACLSASQQPVPPLFAPSHPRLALPYGAGTLLEFGTDINAARYVNGVRETPNGDVRS